MELLDFSDRPPVVLMQLMFWLVVGIFSLLYTHVHDHTFSTDVALEDTRMSLLRGESSPLRYPGEDPPQFCTVKDTSS